MINIGKTGIPRGIFDQHVAVLGKTRSGKSSAMRYMIEHLLDMGKPVCIIDPKGDWWGIKLSANGCGPGYPVVIFGGEHADIPINPHVGAQVAELFATGNRPCLIDLGGWMPAHRTRFWIDFASTLFRLTKGHRHLVIDEVHNFAPKNLVSFKSSADDPIATALHWTNRLASEGLGKGLQMFYASQRPQKVHNDTLTSAETLIAMRVLHPSDRGAVSDWIKGCGDPVLGNEVLGSLAQLQRGEGWVWSPELGFGPKRVVFPKFNTYDSFAPQSVGVEKRLKGWAEVDLNEVKERLAEAVEEAKANDPRELRRQIFDLTKQLMELKQKPATVIAAPAPKEIRVPGPERVVEKTKTVHRVVERPIIVAKDRSLLEKMFQGFEKAIKDFQAIEVVVKPLLTRMDQIQTQVDEFETKLPNKEVVTATTTAPMKPQPLIDVAIRTPEPLPKMSQIASVVRKPGDEKNIQSRILGALLWWAQLGVTEPSRKAVAKVAGERGKKQDHFNNVLSAMRTSKLVDYPSANTVTLVQNPFISPYPGSVQERVVSVLNSLEASIMSVLWRHGGSVPRQSLIVLAGSAIYVSNTLSTLNTSGFTRSEGDMVHVSTEIARAIALESKNPHTLSGPLYAFPPTVSTETKPSPRRSEPKSNPGDEDTDGKTYGLFLIERLIKVPMAMTKPQIALTAGRSHTSSSFDKAIAWLVRNDYLVKVDSNRYKPAESVLAKHGVTVPTQPRELLQFWISRLPEYPRLILNALTHALTPTGRETIATVIGRSSKSSSFDTAITTLKELDLIQGTKQGYELNPKFR